MNILNVQEKADEYIGHPYEIDEGSHITNVRQAYIDGYNACLRRWRQTIYQKNNLKKF